MGINLYIYSIDVFMGTSPMRTHPPNPRVASQGDYQKLQELRSLWQEAQPTLEILRSIAGSPANPDAGLLRRWHQRLVPAAPVSPWTQEPDIRTPNGYFEARFPSAVAKYGRPFLQHQQMDHNGFPRTTLLALNEDCLAATLGGDRSIGVEVIFYEPERAWHFYDPAREGFTMTTEAKLKLVASNSLIKCAEAMTALVDVRPLYGEFRSEKALRAVMEKARAIHAAGEEFFCNGMNRRLLAPPSEVVPRLFAQDGLERAAETRLTVNECFERHIEFCEARSLTPLQRREFKSLIAEVIRETFGIGLRHDLRGEDGRASQGWSGLRCRQDALILAN